MNTRTHDLYLLQDGTQADPSDVSPDKNGVLRHKNGPAVCLTEAGEPQTIGMSAETNKKAASAGKDAPVEPNRVDAPLNQAHEPQGAAKPLEAAAGSEGSTESKADLT